MKKVIIPLAPGFEEVEALAVVDILRRAGAEVVLAGTIKGLITGRNNIHVMPDATLDEAGGGDYAMVVLPGGAAGTENLLKDGRVKRLITAMNAQGRFVTAICAAPTVLSAAGLTKDRTITSHPSVRSELKAATISDERVVADGNIITSQGPGTAMEFAFKLVEALYGKEKVEEVNRGVMARI
ncbi:MAG: hypothetical protein A3J24_09480 [Deltaproteobacteria bacterium RIFCSPLOWO2_02_FULL_53_8]|nr:MAG: hypothetical protein A3J24_09480 [Deltaproteobacteria bacterium RIFCSPLOWO2_02_FULL_53_8]